MSHIQKGDICRFRRISAMTIEEWNSVRDKIVTAVEPAGKNHVGFDMWKIEPELTVYAPFRDYLVRKKVDTVADAVATSGA